MEKPQNKIQSILKINEKIKRNIFGLSFKDKLIEKEYIKTEIKMNLKIKLILHLSYLFNFVTKIEQGKFRIYIFTTIIQGIFAFFGIFSIIAYYVIRKNLKLKKFFDYTSGYLSYLYQVIYLIHIFSYEELTDKVFRLKSVNVLNYLTSLEILFSYETSIFFPFLILIINLILILMIFTKFHEIYEHLNFIIVSLLTIIACIIYKRYINEINRRNYIEQYIFKKYSLYYYDIINNMNGYQFTMKNEKILKYNENYKLDILNYKLNKDKIIENEIITNIKETNISKHIHNFNDDIKVFEASKQKEEILDLKSFKNFENSKNENGHLIKNENEFSIFFLKSLIATKIENKELIKFTNEKNPNLFDLYILIEKSDIFKSSTNEFPVEDSISKNINEMEAKYNSFQNSQCNILSNKMNDLDEDSYVFNKIKFLGEFESKINKNIYEVYFRKLKDYDNIIDFSIYNITKIKEAERFKAENDLKNKFFAKIAHEFKTPINSILGLINKIKMNLELMAKEDEEINSNINQVEHLSNYTIFLVHDIIDYSNNNKKLDCFNLKKEKLNIIEIISFCNCILETLLISKGKEKSIHTELIIDENLYHEDFYVNSDNFRIKQILLNFISNSVKFTKSGFIKIKTAVKFLNPKFVEDNGSNNDRLFESNKLSYIENKNYEKAPYLIISVVDSGIGMSEFELENIFEEDKNFIKKDYNLEGSGLGLSIAKFLAQALNLSIKVNSEFGKGSEFSLFINCNFPKILDKNRINRFYSHRQLDCNILKKEILIQNNSLRKFYSNSFKNTHHKIKKEYDLSIFDKNDDELVLIDHKSSFNSRCSNITDKLDELNFYFNREENQFSYINLYNNSINNSVSNNSLSQEDINLINKGCDKMETSEENIRSHDMVENKSSKCEKTKLKREQSLEEDFEKYKTTNFSNKKIIKDIIKIEQSNIKETITPKSYLNKKIPEFSVNNRHMVNHFKYPQNNDQVKQNPLENPKKYQNLKKSEHNNFLYDSINICINESNSHFNKNPESLDFYNEFNKDSPNFESLIKVRKNKILIIDDHKLIRESLVILIKKALKNLNKTDHFEIIEGCDGVDILCNLIKDQTTENQIKCVVTDENMEYINGSEAITIIRKLEKAKKIKNIVIASITAFEDEFNRNKIKESGANIILSKPCSESLMRNFLIDFNLVE